MKLHTNNILLIHHWVQFNQKPESGGVSYTVNSMVYCEQYTILLIVYSDKNGATNVYRGSMECFCFRLADSSAGHAPDVKHCIAGASFAFYDRLFPHLGHVTDIRPHNPDLSKGRSVPDPV